MKPLLLLLLTSLAALSGQNSYLFVTFRGEATPMSEQVYFMVSDNGLDWYAKDNGYQPYFADQLEGGSFTEAPMMDFPFHPIRHGTVMPITREEMARLSRKRGHIELESKSDQAVAAY